MEILKILSCPIEGEYLNLESRSFKMKSPEQYADELLEKHYINPRTSEIKLPVNPIKITHRKGLRVAPYKGSLQSQLSGEAIPDQKLILFNSSSSKERIRFTIAQELGHYILGMESRLEFLQSFFLHLISTSPKSKPINSP